MTKKRVLVKETDPVIYRVTGYLPIIVLIISWLFFIYDQRKVKEYLNGQFLSWEELIIHTMYVLKIIGLVITLFFFAYAYFEKQEIALC